MRWLLLLSLCALGCAGGSPEACRVLSATHVNELPQAIPYSLPQAAAWNVVVYFPPLVNDAGPLLPPSPELLADFGHSTDDDLLLEPDDLDLFAPDEALWETPPEPFCHSLARRVCEDHCHYYSCKSLGLLAIGTGVAAIMANTRADETIRDNYQDTIRNVKTDEVSEAIHTPKLLGNGYVTIPAFAAAAILGQYFDDRPLGHGLGQWGERSLRTVVVGAPPMLAMQWLTGASRPGETSSQSHWKPFDDNNGVSGHSFMGAVPFISAAKMTDNPFWKVGFYAASTLAGLSRINDDRHYPSQVFLGWWMAYVAATAIDQTQRDQRNLIVTPVVTSDFLGMSLEYCR